MDLERRLNAFMSANINEEIDENLHNYTITEINDILSDLYYKISDLSLETTKIGLNKFLVKFKISKDDIEQIISDSKDFKVVFREIVASRNKKNTNKYIDENDENNEIGDIDNSIENGDVNDGDNISQKEAQKMVLVIKELKEKNKIFTGKIAAMTKKIKSMESEVKLLRENL